MYKDSSCRSSPQPPPLTPTPSSSTTHRNQVNITENEAALSTSTSTATQIETATRSPNQPATTPTTAEASTKDEDDAFSCPSESSSDSEYITHSRPSTTSTTSTSSGDRSSLTAAPNRSGRRARCDINSDVRLLRKIGYIASRLQVLAKIYGDFKLVNPYSPAKQRKLLQEIRLKHSIHDPSAIGKPEIFSQRSRSLTPASSVSSSHCGLPTEGSCEEESVTASTVRRKSSVISTSASIVLLEELLIQFYEDRRNKITVIRRRRSRKQSAQNTAGVATTLSTGSKPYRKHLIIMSGKTDSKSVERLLPQGNDNEDESGTVSESSTKASSFFNSNASSSQQQQIQQYDTHGKIFLQPVSTLGDENARRRRASDCSAHPGMSSQLQITLKNNNCAKFPFHRGSCGAAGEHLLAANSIANRATIILSKSCGNVDGGSNGATTTATYASSDLRHIASGNFIGTGASKVTPYAAISSGGSGFGTTSGNTTMGSGLGGAAGNNEYSIVQLNNTIIQCHFNDDDFRALVKELKRKVEYTERMNWLCLSKRPLAPPHRKSSLPKHQEVKKRFLEICDTTFSDEVKAALRLPAFDSYAWSDADVIHLMQTMFIELGFIEKFSIPNETLREWLYEVYKHYNEVPFHNFRHCFCVAQMMYAITRQANLLHRLGDLECLILLVSCICHDLDHPGYNNIYQINARTELALRYNDISPLENHHCSIAFRLLEHPDCNIFKNFNRETFNHIREGIIRCILATDMARHNEILTQFKDITPVFDYSNRAHINLLCMVLIKVADISNEARPMDVAEPWLDRLLQEFFAQSAAEKSEGLPVTPFMDPDKVSKPGSQVRFIGLVLLPLFEALGDLVPEVTELIIIPVRVALDYYKRLNDAQNRTRKSVADASSAAVSENNSAASDGASIGNAAGSFGTIGAPSSSSGAGGNNCGGSISPQMPRSQSGISVKSRRSIPSQKSASRTSVDEPQCLAAELHDLPEGSESGDSETATEVDVAEKTSKFKVDTEGSSNRSKSSHSTSRKSSREKRPSMIGEMCSTGGGQRIRNSYGNIHGYHGQNRGHFGSNRAVSLDQYSTNNNNRRLSDGLQQVISDSNVFYNRQNRGSLETGDAVASSRLGDDLNMNVTAASAQVAALHLNSSPIVPNMEFVMHTDASSHTSTTPGNANVATNGNISPPQPSKQQCCATATESTAASNSTSNGMSGGGNSAATSGSKSSWKARFKQFSDYFSFSFDKNAKRFGSTRSSPSSVRNNNSTIQNCDQGNTIIDPLTGKTGGVVCCTISNNIQTPALLQHRQPPVQHEIFVASGRHRAYSLDVPPGVRGTPSGVGVSPRYSSSSGGGGDSSRKSSSKNEGGGTGEENNSNNTLHSCTGAGIDMPPIRIGSVDVCDTILITTSGLPRVITPANLAEAEHTSLSIDLGMASGGSSSVAEPSKI